ncbi:hypothetical protein [Paenibacillus sp. Soil787]|uniref:hypothetical protein n=1 Tax=Paenibacillus sp. Soil787 TaxID=1736411 RepID=UPI0012E37BE3|nr:hypothetical protein [Paenibacillus sp. Soil787]
MIEKGGKYPTITDFCEKAGISKSVLYKNYPDDAKKIQERRDSRLHKKRKLSPVAKPRGAENLKIAVEQNKLLFIETQRIEKELQQAKDKIAKLEEQLVHLNKTETKNQLLLTGFDFLIRELQMKGVVEERIRTIWKSFENNILPVVEGKNHASK